MKHHFKHKGPNGTHTCIALEPLGPSIREIERQFRGTGLPQTLVKQIASQILLSLDFLHGSCGIIHSGTCYPPLNPTCISDLNIHVKLADFGAGEKA